MHAFVQVATSFIEDKNEEDDRKDCAVYSDLTSTLTPQPCDAKHEWICKVSRGKCSKTGIHVNINAFDQQSTAVFCRRSAKKALLVY